MCLSVTFDCGISYSYLLVLMHNLPHTSRQKVLISCLDVIQSNVFEMNFMSFGPLMCPGSMYVFVSGSTYVFVSGLIYNYIKL